MFVIASTIRSVRILLGALLLVFELVLYYNTGNATISSPYVIVEDILIL